MSSIYENVIRGNGVPLQATFTPSGTLTDVDSHSILFYDPQGNVQGAAVTSPVHAGTGTYTYTYTVPATGLVGVWRVLWQMVKGGQNWAGDALFNVTA